MKKTIGLIMILGAILVAPGVFAEELSAERAKADAYMADGNEKKAFKSYRKLARVGDYDSQYLLSEMYLNGVGTKVDEQDAYSWSFLAAESGNKDVQAYSDELLAGFEDQSKAKRQAMKLQAKYGKDALQHRSEQLARQSYGRGQRYGSCTGSRISCNSKVDAVQFNTSQGYGPPPTPSGGD